MGVVISPLRGEAVASRSRLVSGARVVWRMRGQVLDGPSGVQYDDVADDAS
jgi:hypothetical protein